ncbi:MAG: hypothetical protein CM1200mP26_09130 [Acidimicrobiales bacterium]|nr:MAG: hypothetical protein CM1200mP26_09130 [Acidimicrobiales bacterium]
MSVRRADPPRHLLLQRLYRVALLWASLLIVAAWGGRPVGDGDTTTTTTVGARRGPCRERDVRFEAEVREGKVVGGHPEV